MCGKRKRGKLCGEEKGKGGTEGGRLFLLISRKKRGSKK